MQVDEVGGGDRDLVRRRLEALEAEKERKEGLRALRQILWGGSVDDVGSLNDRDAYVREVHRHLTSEEVVDLFLDAPSDSPADVDEIYNAAMAHVVCGYTQHRPSLLMDADEMFAQLEDAAWVAANEARDQYATMADAAARAGASPNFAQQPQAEQVTVERAVCQILMGRIEDAAYTLGLTQEQLAYGMADPQVERFVADNSPSGDMTEGLCAMADRWLADVAFLYYMSSTPQIVSVAPSTVFGGDLLRIQGQWFSPTPSENAVRRNRREREMTAIKTSPA